MIDALAPSPIEPPPKSPAHWLWRNASLLVAFYGLAIIWGIRNVCFWQPSGFDIFVPVALSIFLGAWAVADSKAQRRPIPMLSRPWFFLFAVLLVPGYVIWSRRWRGFGWICINAIAWYVLATIVMFTGGTVVFGIQWWRPHR